MSNNTNAGRILKITRQTTSGFGLSADYITTVDHVQVLDTAEFERVMEEQRPTRYWDKGLNQGAPVDGLEEHFGKASGIRYLADFTGPGHTLVYADAASVGALLDNMEWQTDDSTPA
jgi:hypothetical protein